jgi:Zn-dependent protease with chaperone function
VKLMRRICAFTIIFALNSSYATDLNTNGLYKQELFDFIKKNEYPDMFNKKIAPALATIQRDIGNYQQVSFLSQLLQPIIITLDGIIVNGKTMPRLYAYVDDLCKKNAMPTPIVCVSKRKGILNATASKLLTTCGAIVIERKLINELSDNALEAAIAHELGHIKYNHINKKLAVIVLTLVVSIPGFKLLIKKYPNFWQSTVWKELLYYALFSLPPCIVFGKSFENAADEFAYRVCDKGDGLIEFFETANSEEYIYEQGFLDTYALLQQHKESISSLDYLDLAARYYVARAVNYVDHIKKWICENTFLGTHPSNDVRIQTVRDYQKSLA